MNFMKFSLLENAISRCSVAFHKIASAWLLEGKLVDKDPWMIVAGDSKTSSELPSHSVIDAAHIPSPLVSSPDLVKKVRSRGISVY